MKKIILLFLVLPFLMVAQVQIGQDIDGEAAGDQFGYDTSVSTSGDRLAVSGKFYDGINGVDSGYVKVYDIDNNSIIQLGDNIYGEGSNDKSGTSIALSADGNRLAISAENNTGINGAGSGHVRIFELQNNNWIQLGNDIDGDVAGDQSGYAIAFSKNGNTVSICSYRNDTTNNDAGQVRVFQFNGTDWIQLGASIYGTQNSDYLGRFMELSFDGLTMALSYKPFNSPGFVRVYQFKNTNWIQIGDNLEGEGFNDNFGVSLDLSNDGNILAVGASRNDGNGVDSGHVRVFQNSNSNWIQIGDDIDGDHADDFFGNSLDLSDDGLVLAVGASRSDGINGTNIDSGQVKLFEYSNAQWNQIGSSIYGEGVGDFFGYSLSLSLDSETLAIGGFRNDVNGTDSGHVRVFDLSPILSIEEILILEFSMFPNPTKTQFSIQLNPSVQLEQLSIYNTLGQMVLTSEEKVVDSSKLSSGSYIVEITTNQGKSSKKLIIE